MTQFRETDSFDEFFSERIVQKVHDTSENAQIKVQKSKLVSMFLCFSRVYTNKQMKKQFIS